MAELSTRTVKGFNLKRAVNHLIEAAKTEWLSCWIKTPPEIKGLRK
jgi:hypothetical protein